ncbi:MAG TPA: hypothetical protein VNN79_07300 [Actinomycetota bacterium]|nr:hypothetical protein [Actinomycetota bacterium]
MSDGQPEVAALQEENERLQQTRLALVNVHLVKENERLREALYYVTGEYHVARNHPDTVETCPDKRCEHTFRALNPLTPVNVGRLLQQPPEQL